MVTALLALITAALAVYTGKLYHATVTIGKDSKTALTIGERAYVFFNKVTNPGFKIALDKRSMPIGNTGIQYVIENQGKTPAILTEIMQKHVFMLKADSFQLPPPINIKKERGQKLPAGISIGAYKPYELRYPWISIENMVEMADVARGDTFLFFMGFIKYRDIFKKGHCVGFCTYYDTVAEEFIAIGDEEYNYTSD